MERTLTALGLAFVLGSAIAPTSAQPAAAEPATQVPPVSGPTFVSGVEMVALNVTVTEARKGLVSNLTRDDFQLFEDGRLAEIALFGSGEVAVDLAVLLDMSGSVSDRFDVVRSAAKGFLHKLRPGDRGAVVGFDQKVQVLADWTDDEGVLDHAIDAARSAGGTSLYAAVYIALRGLGAHRAADQAAQAGPAADESGRAAPVRRQALVVLSDGADTTSLISFEDVLEAARRAAVAIYTIRIVRPVDAAVAHMTGGGKSIDSAYVMNTLARETGARAFTVSGVEMLARSYREIADELAQQYVLGFVPRSGTENQFHAVQVLVPGRPGVQTRTRPGFFVPIRSLAAFRPAGGSE